MDVAKNFVIFRSVPRAKLASDQVDFMRPTAPWERVSNSICVTQRTLDHEVLACKSDNPVKYRVLNERKGSRNHVKFTCIWTLA